MCWGVVGEGMFAVLCVHLAVVDVEQTVEVMSRVELK